MQNTDELRKAGISLGLSHLLDCLGYSPHMVNFRRRHYRTMSYIFNHHDRNDATLRRIVGSKREGCSRLLESDIDILNFFKFVVCMEVNVLKYTESLSKLFSVYTMVPCVYHPGHYKLLLTREGLPSSFTEILCTCLNPSDSGHWLSSKEFRRQAKSKVNENCTAGPVGKRNEMLTRGFLIKQVTSTTGPAVSSSHTTEQIHTDIDRTFTLPCICPSILSNWVQRNRRYNWPPSEAIQKISEMNGNIVATGIKGCHEEEIEWRLCFNEIEILLVDSWNETVTKLYISLKMIKKDILKLGHEITSYMLKNIVFWLSETFPQTDFRQDKLFFWVIKALKLLKKAVKRFNLPYYMIPERNLIAEKLPKYRRKDVIKQINNAIALGPQLLWNCRKIGMAMTMSLPELQLYKEKMNELEWLMLLFHQYFILKHPNSDFTFSDFFKLDCTIPITMRLIELMLSPWPPVVQQQLRECSSPDSMLVLVLK